VVVVGVTAVEAAGSVVGVVGVTTVEAAGAGVVSVVVVVGVTTVEVSTVGGALGSVKRFSPSVMKPFSARTVNLASDAESL
jgi:hypothetical protein